MQQIVNGNSCIAELSNGEKSPSTSSPSAAPHQFRYLTLDGAAPCLRCKRFKPHGNTLKRKSDQVAAQARTKQPMPDLPSFLDRRRKAGEAA